jgi:hypothetical protein
LLTDEALEVLALRPRATPSEIKEAYRDLVKVWHPDRFGNDLRLRQKAELQLKLITEAYRVLQPNRGVNERYTAGSGNAAGPFPRDTSSSRSVYERRYSASPISRNSRDRWHGNAAGIGWMYRGLGVLVILLAGYFIVEHGPMRGVLSSQASGTQPATEILVQQTPEGSPGGQVVHSADSTGAKIRQKSVGRSEDPGRRQFKVRALSAADTDKLETVCSRQRELWGQVTYQSCLKAQLDMMTNPAGKPDLSALPKTERESIESVCSEARGMGSPDRYNRCATEQKARLAAEPARPDLSSLNDVDRHSIESACSHPKNQEGPAAYNRCLERFVNALTGTQN